jgi:hypothetical protein
MLPSLLTRDIQEGLKQFLATGFEPADGHFHGLMSRFVDVQGYERYTWYDATGRIVFTNSKGLVGVGLPRKGGRNTPFTTVTEPGGPRTVHRRFTAPFARANREADYRLAWAFFEQAQGGPRA